MRTPITTLALVLGLNILSAPTLLQQKGGEDVSGPYQVVANWPQPLPHTGYVWGSQAGVFAETPNRVFLLSRGELKLPEKLPKNFTGAWGSIGPAFGEKPEMRNCIVIVDADGKIVESWTQWDHLFEGGPGPHAIKISPYDPQRHVWVVDSLRQQIFEFTNDGKQLVRTLGEAGVEGDDARHFGGPTDIAWLPDGTFFVSDGYTNSRVVKFDKNGKFLMTWGTKGSEPGEFSAVHSIAVDRNRRVYVADRGNQRIQIFDEMGKYLDQWNNILLPQAVMITADQHLLAIDGTTNKFLKYDLNGRLIYSWGTYGTFPGAFWNGHQFSLDSEGNVYIAETLGGRTQKFRPEPGADPVKLAGMPMALMPKATK